ncbi:SMR family transporter [Polycladidibacter stylochi]|uniref:SMR family transporter n=1 Tax=Polycladidibacter stylochi TaxID=1807766 RepID=UPI0008378AF3|nr:SMR family transporter [Pseudovibrio stylochi]
MKVTLTAYLSLGLAIIMEVAGTSLLTVSEQFSRLLPSIGVTVCYAASFYFLSISLSSFPVGIAYAIWSGLGILLISSIGYSFFGQTLDIPAIIGLGFILVGVIIVNVFSKSSLH